MMTSAAPAQSSAKRKLAGADWRLHKHADYQRVYQGSRKQFSAHMTYFVAQQPTALAASRVGITAGRVLGKAVERNRIKRRMRAAIRAHFSLLPSGRDIVLHPKRKVAEAPWPELTGEVERIFLNIARAARKNTAAMPSAPLAAPGPVL
jgi:ribonuclease P protein component